MGAKGGNGGHTIQDEGSDLAKRKKLNFVGAGVDVTDDSGNDASKVTITSGGGGEANTSSNVGTGEGLAKAKVAVDLPFKSLLGTANEIDLVGNVNDVTFSLNSLIARLNVVQTFTAKQTYSPSATVAGLNVGSRAGDVAAPVNGDLHYNSTLNALRAYINGAYVSLGAGGAGTAVWAYNSDEVWAEGNQNGYFSNGSTTGLSNEHLRSLYSPLAGTQTDLLVRVNLNSNTVDGAHFDNRVNQASGNLTVVVDQATGTFQDTVNSDVIAIGDQCGCAYFQGDSTCRNRGFSLVFAS